MTHQGTEPSDGRSGTLRAPKPAIMEGSSTTLAVAGPEEPQPAAIAAPQPRPTVPDPELASIVRDPQTTQATPRARALLIREIQGLESQFASMHANAPERPKLMRQLADGYVELESSAAHDRALSQAAIGQAASSADRARVQQELVKSDKLATAARQAAIRYYTRLADGYPDHCQTVSPLKPSDRAGCVDEVIYSLALEQEKAGQRDAARKSYLKLVQSAPQSKYVPLTYLAFGELFFEDALTDPSKWELALRAYEEVLKFPPPQNEAWGYAHYEIAHVRRHQEDTRAAIASLKHAIDFSNKFRTFPVAAPLAAAARREIVPAYASVGSPEKARQFFKPLSGDPPGQNVQLFLMLDALINRYLLDNKRDAAAAVCKGFPGGADAPTACQTIAAPPTQVAQ